MFNLQPGQGIGFGASKEIALGLGYCEPSEAVVEISHGVPTGGISYQAIGKVRTKQLEQIQKEDDEMLNILIQAVTSGIL